MNVEVTKRKSRAALLAICCSLTLVIIKLAVGILSGAISIVAEAAHSFVDLLAAFMAYVAVRKSGLPPDDAHNYGHGKVENLSGAVESVLIVLVAVWIVYESVQKLMIGGKPDYLLYGMVCMAISVTSNIFVSRHLYKVAEATQSPALKADALHNEADIWTSGGVLVGLVLIKLTGWDILDPIIAIAMALIIFREGLKLTKANISDLIDANIAEDDEAIRKLIARHQQIVSVHKLRTRRSGGSKHIDMHMVFDRDVTLRDAHELCHHIEKDIKDELGAYDVVIHCEPCYEREDFSECPRLIEGKCDGVFCANVNKKELWNNAK